MTTPQTHDPDPGPRDAPPPYRFPENAPATARAESELSAREAAEEYAAALERAGRRKTRGVRLRPGFFVGLLIFIAIAFYAASRNPGLAAAEREAARTRAAELLTGLPDPAYADTLLDFAHALAVDYGAGGGGSAISVRPPKFDEQAYRELVFALMLYKAEFDGRAEIVAPLISLRDQAGVRKIELPGT